MFRLIARLMYPQEKIVSKYCRLQRPSFSIEVVPPADCEFDDVIKLVSRASCAKFVAITWQIERNPPFSVRSSTLNLLECLLQRVNPTPNLLVNLACVGQTKMSMQRTLDELITLGIRNVFIVRGDYDTVNNSIACEFKTASQLVSFVKSYAGDHFCIGVPGYPDDNSEDAWQCLNEKITRGADFIITQIFLKAAPFFNFLQGCREMGIQAPVIPGVMPITSRKRLDLIRRLRAAPIPQEMEGMVDDHSIDAAGVNQSGMKFTIELCKSIASRAEIIHFFSLNDADNLFPLLDHLSAAASK